MQRSPSLHEDPLGRFVVKHCPFEGLHDAVWHGLDVVHDFGVPEQFPFVQESFSVQASPSLHEVPLLTLLVTHWPVEGLHDAV